MAQRYPAEWLEELRSKSDIIQVVSGYVPLKKNGKKHWGLCPFHGEKTASFSVDEERQAYYCFGCKASGSVINFIMEIEHVDFREAVKLLADRAHMPVPEMVNNPDYDRERAYRDRLREANREAARFYYGNLFTPSGEAALKYLRGRGLDDAVIRKFGIGAAPDNWDHLVRYLKGKGYQEEEIAAAGLAVSKPAEYGEAGEMLRPKRIFDMFRNWAIFPILDQYNQVLAFGGRSLDGSQPKYLNTSDTPVFNKRKGVFAANLLRKERNLSRVILVEGYMDVVSLVQFGIRGVCATLGTSLTEEQAQLLRRYAPMVYLAYDGDSAGQHAILRGLDIFGAAGIETRVLDFPEGLDPDEYIRKYGAEAFEKLPVLRPEVYRMRRLKEQFAMDTQEGRTEYARACAPYLKPLDALELENRLKELSVETGFSRETLLQQIQMTRVQPADSGQKRPYRPHSVVPKAPEASFAGEETLISAFIQIPQLSQVIEKEDFADPVLKKVFEDLCRGESPAAILEAQEDEETRQRLGRILMQSPVGSESEIITMANQCISRMKQQHIKKQIDEAKASLASLDGEEKLAALEELTMLMTKLKDLQS